MAYKRRTTKTTKPSVSPLIGGVAGQLAQAFGAGFFGGGTTTTTTTYGKPKKKKKS